ncbi:MAG TPA: hypothetical protein DEB74_00145 [Lachnospiraceae bacterium]|nr:hypothetical protein [Lachnospiraceae bacterium]
MIKDKIKNCLEENIILWQTEANSLPKIKFDEYTYEKSNLYVGDSDTEGRIQWHYTPVSRVLDFSDLEMESHIVLPQDLKDYYNAYFFLELNGFIDGECISFDPIDEIDDVLENLAYFMSGEEDEKFGTTNLIILGIYGHKYPFGISKIGNGQVVVVMEDNEEYVLAESLCELFTKLKVANPQLGWYSILTSIEQKDDDSDSFIGGKPCIPADILLPTCKVCGEPLTFFFQVAFPKGHMWEGKSLAFFFCTSTYYKHDAHEWFPPILLANDGEDVSFKELESNSYQTLFKVYFFDTKNGVLREDYHEKVMYHRIDWKPGRRRDKKIPIILAGEPIWMDSFQRERPKSCGGKNMELILQVADYFNFEKYPDAPPEMKKSYIANKNSFQPRKENNYTLFCDFNRVFLWGTNDKEEPVFGINVQSDV